MKTRHAFSLAIALSLAACLFEACAHTQRPSALVVTAATLDAAGITFEAVAAGMQSASDAHSLTREQVLAWNDFLGRWKVAYPSACKAWREARAKADDSGAEQAAAAVSALLMDLNAWASVLTQARRETTTINLNALILPPFAITQCHTVYRTDGVLECAP